MEHSDKELLKREVLILVRVLFDCLVTVPGAVLFGIVILLSLNGSLTGQLISEAQGFTRNAPEGMVMVCQTAEPSRPALPGSFPPPPSLLAEPCTKVPVKTSEYAVQSDRTLLFVWRVIAVIAFGARMVLWAFSDSPSNLSKIKFRRKKW